MLLPEGIAWTVTQDCHWPSEGLGRPDCILGVSGVHRCLGSPVGEAGKINRWNHYNSVTPGALLSTTERTPFCRYLECVYYCYICILIN